MGECESQKREGYGRDDYLSLPCSNALYMRVSDKNGREEGIFCRNLRRNENSANIKRIEQVCQIQSEFAELTLIIDWGRCHRHRFSFEPYCNKKNPN